jgi:hypothetical protein
MLRQGKEVLSVLEKPKAILRFHNPNSAELAAGYILGVFMEASEKKIDRALKATAQKKRLSIQ